jgi:CDP-diglyceride synthetase
LSVEKKFEFKRPLLVVGNLVVLAWVLLASLSIIISNQLYGWLYLLFTAAIVWLILRRAGCSSCYYCKSCTSGFGRLSGYFFGDRSTKDFGNKTALGFVAVVYFLLIPVPLLYLAGSLVQGFQPVTVALFVCLLLLTAYSAFTWAKPQRKTKPAKPAA